jgi:peptide/nickel transport system ATP-binding protein
MDPHALLEVKNLLTEFRSVNGPVKAVNNVSFSIRKGETLAIVGESGSGKSVTSLSIMGLINEPAGKVTNGEILYHSKEGHVTDLLKSDKLVMRKYRGNEIAMIFQEPMTSLNPVIKCGDQVMEAIMVHKKISQKAAREKTIALFKEVQLPSPEAMLDRYPHQLSGGQKQRVMIAMAISCSPGLLIADEPTTALDVTVQKTIVELMGSLQKRYNMGLLFITHDLGLVAGFADHVAVMYKGEIVELGSVKEVFTDPKHLYTKSLLACRPRMDIRLKRLPVVSDFTQEKAKTEHQSKTSQKIRFSESVISPEERKHQHHVLYNGNKILSLRNVSTWFPSKKSFFGKTLAYNKAVDGVSFDVYEGETVGLVGESGCGKTTLGRTILKLAQASAGEIIYNNENILQLNERSFRPHRREMQLIFQDPYSSLNPRITIGEAISEPMRVHGIYKSSKEVKEKAMDLLRKVGLEEKHYNRFPHEFSGGQRQRICIARALGLNPRFIICDESVSALDVSVQAQVLNLLNDLKKEFGFTCIFISHDLSVVKYMSDRMIVMNRGKIEEEGDPDEIYANPKSDYTRKLISSIPELTVEELN